MNQRTDDLRQSWDSRQQALGNNERSVLCKGLPPWLNQRIHRQHIAFIDSCLTDTGGRLLDMGCGYGRLSSEIIHRRPEISAEGVELCEAFARQFRTDVGPCSHNSVQDFQPEGEFNVLLSVTCLQYLELDQLTTTLQKYWAHLKPGGRFICIEQYENIFVTVRKQGYLQKMQPTGGDITYFRRHQLRKLLSGLTDSRLVAEARITGLPLGFPTMHDAVCVEKRVTP